MRMTILFVFALLFIGCGGGGTTTPGPTAVDPLGWWEIWDVTTPQDSIHWNIIEETRGLAVYRHPSVDGAGDDGYIGIMEVSNSSWTMLSADVGWNVRTDCVYNGALSQSAISCTITATTVDNFGPPEIETYQFAGQRSSSPL